MQRTQNAYLGFTETWIKWITEKNGKKFYKLAREKITASTRVCNCCGASDAFLKFKEINKIEDPLSIREFTCPYCGSKLDRDINAARNIRDWGIEDLNKAM
jgi:putative transposase